jgi:hypothetical protein
VPLCLLVDHVLVRGTVLAPNMPQIGKRYVVGLRVATDKELLE